MTSPSKFSSLYTSRSRRLPYLILFLTRSRSSSSLTLGYRSLIASEEMRTQTSVMLIARLTFFSARLLLVCFNVSLGNSTGQVFQQLGSSLGTKNASVPLAQPVARCCLVQRSGLGTQQQTLGYVLSAKVQTMSSSEPEDICQGALSVFTL